MSFTWPEFMQPEPLGDGRSWTAKFDSYDQRNEDCYYVVTVAGGAPFMVKVPLYWAGDDWSGPGFVDRLRDELRSVARGGRSNTDYRGSVLGNP